jgi:hypothetical protein
MNLKLIWEQTQENYRGCLSALSDKPPISGLQDFVQTMFMGPFTKLRKVYDMNRPSHIWLIDKVFRKSGNREHKDILKYPDGFINIDTPFDKERHAATAMYMTIWLWEAKTPSQKNMKPYQINKASRSAGRDCLRMSEGNYDHSSIASVLCSVHADCEDCSGK